MIAVCIDAMTPRSGPRTVLYVFQNCWSSDLLLIIVMIVL